MFFRCFFCVLLFFGNFQEIRNRTIRIGRKRPRRGAYALDPNVTDATGVSERGPPVITLLIRRRSTYLCMILSISVAEAEFVCIILHMTVAEVA